MKKVELDHSLFKDFPKEIIQDILSRLPTKACLNCKLVCKGWKDIIVEPDFDDRRRSRGCYTTLLLRGAFYDERQKFVLLELDKPHKPMEVDESGNLSVSADTIIRFKSELPHTKNGKLSLVNECNGIICFRSDTGPVVVCNLLRGKYVEVSQPAGIGYYVYGLGCRLGTHEFKLLRVRESNYSKDCVAEVLTLGTNDWRIVGDAPLLDLMIEPPTFFNGSLYWFSRQGNCVQSFNFESEQFSHIELPEETSNRFVVLCVFDSCLCISCARMDINQFCDIWVMRQNGVKESWVKQYVFQNMSGLAMPIIQDSEEQMLLTHVNKDGDYGLAVGDKTDNESGIINQVSVLGVFSFETVTFNAKFSKSLILN